MGSTKDRFGEGGGTPPPDGSSPSEGLFLLATVHGDPAGYRRAWRLLEHLRPSIITVEISPFSVRYRERKMNFWRKRLLRALKELPPHAREHLAVARVMAQVDLPFEYRAARDWGSTYRIPVKFLDSGEEARRHLPRFAAELLTSGNLARLLETPATGNLEDYVKGEFLRARRALARKGFWGLSSMDAEQARRERLMARRLRQLTGENGRVVHLGGWEHLIPRPDGHSLLQLLRDLNPRVFLLDEADKLPIGKPPFKFAQ